MSKQDSVDIVVKEEIEKMVTKVREFIKGLPEEWKFSAAGQIISEATIWSTDNLFEGLGLLEHAKLLHREISQDIAEEEKREHNEEDS